MISLPGRYESRILNSAICERIVLLDRTPPLLPVKPNGTIDLRKLDPGSKSGLADETTTRDLIEEHTQAIGRLQDLLYADGTQALLVILQGMDASGKDGTVRKVFDHVNPMGVHAVAFKSPSELERQHDFLWRVHKAAPPLGSIGIFNRSHYEEVLVVRVHAAKLLPPECHGRKHIWKLRYRRINEWESLLSQTGTRILKFFLHISKDEQKKRFQERQKDPQKHWKLAASDFAERPFWDHYQDAYEQMLRRTSTDRAPWYVVPADHKWVRDYHVARVVHETLLAMRLRPRGAAQRRLLHMTFK